MSRSALILPTPEEHLREIVHDYDCPDSVDDPQGIVSRAVAVIALVAEGLRDDGVLQTLGHVEALRASLLKHIDASAPIPTRGIAGEPTMDAPARDRFLRVDEVMKKTGLGRTTIWRMERAGEFPRRRQVGANSVAWLESELAEWIASRPAVEEDAYGGGSA